MDSPTTFFQELAAAARGVVGLLRGERAAPRYFDLGARGLAGSFIALLLIVGFNALLDGYESSTSTVVSLLRAGILIGSQFAGAALALRQFGRRDSVVAYLTADNWATFFLTLLSSLCVLAGIDPQVVVIVLGIAVIVVEVNIARLVVGLAGWQVVVFIIAQMAGALVGLMVIGLTLPLPEEMQAAMRAAG